MGHKRFGLVIDLDEAESVESVGLDIEGIGGISIHVQHGNITGTLALQANDLPGVLDWQTIDEVEFTQPAGSAGGEIINVGNLRSRYVRVTYDHDIGTGELRVALTAKGGGL